MPDTSPIENDNVLLEKTTPLTSEEKDLFAYFGENAKILPPFRILNPQNIVVGDMTAIREGCHINAFRDLSFLMDYIDEEFRGDFEREDYRYDPMIKLGRELQIGRFAFMSCTASITLEDNVLLSERVFVGDNNHSFSHEQVPIMQQPNKAGKAIVIGKGTWVGVGVAILAGTRTGRNCVIGANSVCKDEFPDHAVVGPEPPRCFSGDLKRQTAMSKALEKKYDRFYDERNPVHVYPVEFVVRAFLGNYPRLKNDKGAYPGKKVLDLGFGDGRNIPLLSNLGMEVAGVEISEKICQLAKERMEALGVGLDARVGRNSDIPFENGIFDYVLACHACYYVDPETTFTDNLKEVARILKPGGRFVFSAPISTSYIFDGAKDVGEGHMEIANDPYGVRNGYVLKKFDSEEDLRSTLSPLFEDFAIGACRNDFWGIEEHVWTVVCQRV